MLQLPLVILAAPFIIALIAIIILLSLFSWMVRGIHGEILRYRFLRRYAPHGRYILFIHSDSPVWGPYLEAKIFPEIRDRAVFLNWSKRHEWRRGKPLEARMLDHWGGPHEFNPMAIIAPRAGPVETVRFHQAFKDCKHGNDRRLHLAEQRFRRILKRLPSV